MSLVRIYAIERSVWGRLCQLPTVPDSGELQAGEQTPRADMAGTYRQCGPHGGRDESPTTNKASRL